MWNRIKNFIFEEKNVNNYYIPSALLPTYKNVDNSHLYAPNPQTGEIENKDDELIKEALEHYCWLCHRGFSTRGATTMHKRSKHTNGK